MDKKAMVSVLSFMIRENAVKKRLKWSVYFQTPDYLERTRMMMIRPEYEPLICTACGLSDGSRVLDVGCGTGFFARLLKRRNPKAHVTGLELEEEFLERAKLEAKAENLDIEFLQGDALALPFEDGSFDLVVSYTFLTSVLKPEKAFDEMKRVLRRGGRIASVTAMNLNYLFGNFGEYPEECAWGKELQQLTEEIWKVYQKISPISSYSNGLTPDQLPRFFASQGMKNICAYPIGSLFSLSNNALSVEQKERWLTLYQKSEEDKLNAFLSLPNIGELLSVEKAERYKELVREKCAYYRANPNENAIWEWYGGANILLTGDKGD